MKGSARLANEVTTWANRQAIQRPENPDNARLKDLATYIDETNLLDSLECLGSRRKLLKKRFIAGMVTGVVGAVGITIVLTIAALILATAGTHAPGQLGDFARDTSQTLQNKADHPK